MALFRRTLLVPSGSEFQISWAAFRGDKWCLALNPRWQHEFTFVDTFPHVYRLRLKQNTPTCSSFLQQIYLFFFSPHSFFTTVLSISFLLFFSVSRVTSVWNSRCKSIYSAVEKWKWYSARKILPKFEKKRKVGKDKKEKDCMTGSWFMIAGKLKSKPCHLD